MVYQFTQLVFKCFHAVNFRYNATVMVHVNDVNDWVPNFEPLSYTATVSADVKPGSILSQVEAIDGDLTAPNNQVTYRLARSGVGVAHSYFDINPRTGLVTVTKSLDRVQDSHMVVSADVVIGCGVVVVVVVVDVDVLGGGVVVVVLGVVVGVDVIGSGVVVVVVAVLVGVDVLGNVSCSSYNNCCRTRKSINFTFG